MGKKLIAGQNDLASQRPHLSKSWQELKNLPLTPESVTYGSSLKVWWICELGHEWEAVISNRAKGVGCPYCAGKRVQIGYNDLQTLNPKAATEWNNARNAGILPSQVAASSNTKYWWRCKFGHEWEISPNGRRGGRGCPVCSNKAVQVGHNDLATTHPEIASEFDTSKNSEPLSSLVSGSNKKVWWKCSNGHDWQSTVNNRTRGQGCPFCSGRNAVTGKNDLQSRNPEIAKDWVTQKNLPLTPDTVSGGSGHKVWWQCSLGHQWKAIIQDRVQGSGCPFCSGNKVLKGFNDLRSSRPDLAKDLLPHLNNGRDGSEFTLGSKTKLKWICERDHVYEATVNKRVSGQGCPYCSNTKVYVGFNDLASQFPELASQLHPTKNPIGVASQIVGKSNKKVWWVCPEGHEWQTSPEHRIRGRGCPTCAVTGYVPTKPGYLYFIFHPELGARKIGIANIGSDRLETFLKQGWRLYAKWETENGFHVQRAETKLLRWIRRDLELPQFLSKKEMGRAAGWSETFSAEGTSNEMVRKKIEEVFNDLKGEI